MADAKRDSNSVTTLIAVSNVDGSTPVLLWADPVTHRLLVDSAAGQGTVTNIATGAGLTGGPITSTGTIALNSKLSPLDTLGTPLQYVRVNAGGTALEYGTLAAGGTVTSVSVVSANGFTGSVATATTTPAITLTTSITGVLKGNGTAISAATDGSDYLSSSTGVTLAQGTAQTIGTTTNRVLKLWATDITVTNAIAGSITGNAATVTTNANLTGVVTSVGNATSLGSFTSAQLATALTDETGSGANVFATSPTLVTPLLGTPTSGVLTNCTGLPISTGVSGLAAGMATFLGTPTSANLIAAVTDETGTGSLVFGTTPTFTTSMLFTSGFVMNFASSNVVLTHSSGVFTVTTGTLKVTNPTNNSTSVLTTDGVQTTSNKRETKRFVTVTQAATPTINTDNTDVASITGLAQAITSMTTNLSGTPVAGDMLMIQITDNGTARAITWGASFSATTVALPTTTVISTLLRVLFQWDTVSAKWNCIATS